MGWLFDLPQAATWLPRRPSMSPMTAALIVLGTCAAAVLGRSVCLAAWLAALQGAVSAFVLLAHRMALPGAWGEPVVWWPSPITATVLLASSAASSLMAAGRVALGQITALGVLLFAVLLGLGHVLPQADLYRHVPGTGVAIPTVIAVVVLSLCQLLVCRRYGVVDALAAGSLAGRAGLGLLCGGCVGVLLLAGVVMWARREHAFDADTAVLLAAWGAMAVLVATMWALAVAVDKADAARRAAESERDEVRQLVAAAVTHDLRSPLLAASMSTVLLRRLVERPDAVLAIDRVERSHRRLDRLLRTLMDALAAEGTGSVVVSPGPCRLGDLVDDVIREHESMLGTRVIRQGQAAGVWDCDALTRVMENLLLNAQKYGTPGTPITCRISTLPDRTAEVTIENIGPPIPQDEWEAIFKPFARGRRTAHQAGWGVGLAFARSVATAHGGSLRVAQSDAHRTAFTLRLPQAEAHAAGSTGTEGR